MRWVIQYEMQPGVWLRGAQYFRTLEDAQHWAEQQQKDHAAANRPRPLPPFRFIEVQSHSS